MLPPAGKIKFDSSAPEILKDVHEWDVRRHILRQDEVSEFIRSSKSEKYSTLSPLLGLQSCEDLAQNIAKVRDNVLKKTKLEVLKDEKSKLQLELAGFFNSMEPTDVRSKVIERAGKYVTNLQPNEETDSVSGKALRAITVILEDKEPAV
jgi:DNA repair exonuclease SbcCD ATPase subunit